MPFICEFPVLMGFLAYIVSPIFSGDFSKDEERGDGGGDYVTEVRELGRSKWSENLEEHENEEKVEMRTSVSALSGLVQTYGKGGKSVRWGDQVSSKFSYACFLNKYSWRRFFLAGQAIWFKCNLIVNNYKCTGEPLVLLVFNLLIRVLWSLSTAD